MIRIGGSLLLLNSTQVVPRPQHQSPQQSQHQDESALLRCKVVELNRNTVRLIVEAEKLIQESKQLSARIKSFEDSSAKPK
jgi:flagellar basal body rod protein FlgB